MPPGWKDSLLGNKESVPVYKSQEFDVNESPHADIQEYVENYLRSAKEVVNKYGASDIP